MRSLVYALLLCGLLSACNTVRGIGEDIQQAGSAISRATR
ncbi:entericidin B [Aeromonas sp. RU39B]|jgi:entericidin B|nr:entericidin A/B family lipoprotein [Aeromonas sp. RU39B]SIR33959.1 entericidin B [Aeromonas sp. RU39B]